MIILALGTNLGDRAKNLEKAIELISKFAKVVKRSSVIDTEPVGFQSDNRFLNMAIAIETDLEPMALLDATQEVERLMGRTKKSVDGVYHDRPIDIDIIEYNGLHIDTPRLTLPHPRAAERNFVQIPVSELIS